MWDSLFAKVDNLQDARSVLPADKLWLAKRWLFDGDELTMDFQESGGEAIRSVSCNPIYFSFADELIEALGAGVDEFVRQSSDSSFCKEQLVENIAQSAPDITESIRSLEMYVLNAREWNLRFACYGSPKIVEDN
ncbi:hypothetical protein ACQKH5_16120 [Hyphomonas sp. NPDC076900]|uniref:hypothetical protein n=1 Tax=unclassified Hyphomonas TaxID=2630699 RepID=UPI003D06EECA